MKKTLFITLILGVLAVALAGCGSSGGDATETPRSAEAVYTSAAMTADPRLNERFSQATTPAPTLANPTAAVTNTATITPTVSQPTPAGTASAPPSSGDRAEFVADVTIPDGTNMAPN